MEFTVWDIVQHYLDYLIIPAILTLALVGFFVAYFNHMQGLMDESVKSNAIPGCFRLGLSKKARLTNADRNGDDGSTKVKALFTYPLRGCRGVGLAASQVDWHGLKYDDLFVLAHLVQVPSTADNGPSQHWEALTNDECPGLSLLSIEIWPSTHGKPHQPADADTKTAEVKCKPPKGGYYHENGGCLVVKFPCAPTLNPFGLFTFEKIIQIPLEPRSKRARARRYTNASYLDEGNVRDAVHVTGEIDGKTLLALQRFLGYGPLSLFRTRSASGSLDSHLTGSVRAARCSSNVQHPTVPRANVYLTGLATNIEEGDVVVTGRRLARTKEGRIEIDGEYSVSNGASSNDGVFCLNPLFEQGLLKIGDDFRTQPEHGQPTE